MTVAILLGRKVAEPSPNMSVKISKSVKMSGLKRQVNKRAAILLYLLFDTLEFNSRDVYLLAMVHRSDC